MRGICSQTAIRTCLCLSRMAGLTSRKVSMGKSWLFGQLAEFHCASADRYSGSSWSGNPSSICRRNDTTTQQWLFGRSRLVGDASLIGHSIQPPVGNAWMAGSSLLIRKATRSSRCCMLTARPDAATGGNAMDDVIAHVGDGRIGIIRGVAYLSDRIRSTSFKHTGHHEKDR